MKPREGGRRQFLKSGLVLAGVAMNVSSPLVSQAQESQTPQDDHKDYRSYGNRSNFATSARVPYSANGLPHLHGWVTPLQDSVGIITPSGLHFWEDHGYVLPVQDLDPGKHRLMIHGLVDRPKIYTLEELRRLPSVSRPYFLECNANGRPLEGPNGERLQQVYGKASCSEWTGVPLSLLLGESGLKKGGTWLVVEGADSAKYTTSIPIEKAMDDALVAYGQNGEDVRPEQGYPLRMIVPGWQGHNNVKHLRRIKVVDQPYMAKWESGSNADDWPDGKSHWFRYEMGPRSIITRPCPERPLSDRGFYQITGLAWSGGGAIRKVEVSVNGGRTWNEARLQEPVFRMSFTRFHFDWNWNGEEAVLQSRCTDERGEVQPTLSELGKIKGVDPDKLRTYFQFPSNRVDHINAIQPWKLSRDGSISNAMFS